WSLLSNAHLAAYARWLTRSVELTLPSAHPWRNELLLPIPKRSTRCSPKDLRPIKLTEVDYRALDAFITQEVSGTWARMGLLHWAQFGFRAGRSREDALLILRSALERARKNAGLLLLLNTDVSKAFDRVPPWVSAIALKLLGTPPEITRFLVSMATGNRSHVLWRDCIVPEL
ncbi:MAG: reverse transcriptase domain-containing protein, partial [Bacteroidota bacterium]